jgi:hypothetical protein
MPGRTTINNHLLIDPFRKPRYALDPAIGADSFATSRYVGVKHMRYGLLASITCSLLLINDTSAFDLKLTGVVTEYLTGSVISNALVRVYKDGVKQYVTETGSFGHYTFTLDNNAKYIIRFSAPGHQNKCFSVDTHGLEWQGENKSKDLFVEMTMFEKIGEMDLSFFDLPMGMAFFEPATGLVSWDTEYDKRIRGEVQSIMSEYERKMTATADASRPRKAEGSRR